MRFLTLLVSALFVSATSAFINVAGHPIDLAPRGDDTPEFKVPGENPIKHCEDPANDILDLERVDLVPNPPKAGQNLTITATGTLSKPVDTGAQIHVRVKYGLITILKATVDLCDNVKEVNLTCPLPANKRTTLFKEVTLPREIPPGKYTVGAEVETKDNERVTCLEATVEFHREHKDGQKLMGWNEAL